MTNTKNTAPYLVETAIDARKTEILSRIAQYQTVQDKDDAGLAEWMTSQHQMQIFQERQRALSGRFKRMQEKGIGIGVRIPPPSIPGQGEVQRFREGLRQQIADWQKELADAKPTCTKETVNGMELDVWRFASCEAQFGVGETWATLYGIASKEEGKGHATNLLRAAKTHYEAEGKIFGGSVALNERMRAIYQRLGITEYAE